MESVLTISGVKRLLPPRARRRVGQVYRSVVGLPGIITVWRTTPASGDRVRVFYGGLRVSADLSGLHGGMVKVEHLNRLFPDSPGACNLLYLISSRLPPAARWMVRLAQRKGIKVVWNQNGVAYPAWHGPGWERTNAPLAEGLHQADYVMYQSEFCKRSADRYLGLRQGPWEILHNAVDTDRFTPADSDPAPGRLVLLIAGSHWHWYRVETAIRVLAKVSRMQDGVRLVIAGRLLWAPTLVEAVGQIRRLASDLGVLDRVEIVGAFTHDQAPAILRRAHMMLHTQYQDACPGLVLEAMACGLPVVYSASGGVPELVGPDAGIGVDVPESWEHVCSPDPERMAMAVRHVADQRAHYAQQARQRAVTSFEVRRWLDRQRIIFETLLR